MKFDIISLFDKQPYSLSQNAKNSIYKEAIFELTKHHYKNSTSYKTIIDKTKFDLSIKHKLSEYPFIPVRLFKKYDLLSVPKTRVTKIMTSSGTTGQQVSKIYLDKTNSINQIKILSKIVSSFIGNKRIPLLIIDSKTILKNRNLYSARGAGITGFSMFGRNVTYALNENMEIDKKEVAEFCQKYQSEKVLVFGFTFMIWQYFIEKLSANINCHLPKGILIHGGGWKKLFSFAINNETFKANIKEKLGIELIYNYYGMVEQAGSIFMECEKGYLHASIFSDVIIRSPKNFIAMGLNNIGLIQLISLLPTSYPGHLIITEDIGEIIGVDDCECGRLGKYFKVYGRIKNAEVRGCSDTVS